MRGESSSEMPSPGSTVSGSSRWGCPGSDGRVEGMAGWVRRLFEGRGLALPDRKLHWLGCTWTAS